MTMPKATLDIHVNRIMSWENAKDKTFNENHFLFITVHHNAILIFTIKR